MFQNFNLICLKIYVTYLKVTLNYMYLLPLDLNLPTIRLKRREEEKKYVWIYIKYATVLVLCVYEMVFLLFTHLQCVRACVRARRSVIYGNAICKVR